MSFFLIFFVIVFCFVHSKEVNAPKKPITLVIDSDYGQDFDDSFALALALKAKEAFDIKLFLTAAHNTKGRAQVAAKFLDIVKRTDIPVGIGTYQDPYVGPLEGWAKNYNLSTYPGQVFEDGVKAFADVLDKSTDPVYVLAIAPLVNFKSLIERFPEQSKKIAGIFQMGGSINYCYDHRKGNCPEYNIKEDIKAAQLFYEAGFENVVATPLDTCGVIFLEGDLYQKFLKQGNVTDNVITQTLIETYCYWSEHGGYYKDCTKQSSPLFDATAAFLAIIAPHYEDNKLSMKELKIIVDKEGNTLVNDQGKVVNEALEWIGDGKEVYENWIVDTLLNR